MSRFFTSDQHFGHANILKYETENRVNGHGRTFKNVDLMDDFLVDKWNSVVKEKDEVFCIGDMCMKMMLLREILPFLNGRKILIVGNHDPFFKRAVNGRIDEARAIAIEVGFSDLHAELELTVPGIGLVRLNHFPYAPPNLGDLQEFEKRYLEHRPKAKGESLLIHGHVHSEWQDAKYRGMPPMINVGVDMWELKPISEAEIVAKFESLKG